jgi:hypothetical protein
VLQYLRGTNDYRITDNGCSDLVYVYVDSDFACDLEKRRSSLGYIFILT